MSANECARTSNERQVVLIRFRCAAVAVASLNFQIVFSFSFSFATLHFQSIFAPWIHIQTISCANANTYSVINALKKFTSPAQCSLLNLQSAKQWNKLNETICTRPSHLLGCTSFICQTNMMALSYEQAFNLFEWRQSVRWGIVTRKIEMALI